MFMKIKDKYKKSLSRTLPDQTPTTHPRAAVRKAAHGPSPSRLIKLLAAKSREQSENVYENKGQVQNVADSYGTRPNADHLPVGSPKPASHRSQDLASGRSASAFSAMACGAFE
jgi:hypothetical protein